MKTFTYWAAPIEGDSSAYNVRAKTRREVSEKLEAMDLRKTKEGRWIAKDRDPYSPSFGKIRKVQVIYDDLMDLVDTTMGEGRPDEGN